MPTAAGMWTARRLPASWPVATTTITRIRSATRVASFDGVSGLAPAQREPHDEAGERREDQEAPENLVPPHPQVVATQEAASEGGFKKYAERENAGKDGRGARRCDAPWG